MFTAGSVDNQYTLIIYLAGFDFADVFFFSDQLERVIFMCPDNKERTAVIDSTGKFDCTEITVGYPGIILYNAHYYRFEQEAFLRMAVFTGKDVYGQSQHGVINDQ